MPYAITSPTSYRKIHSSDDLLPGETISQTIPEIPPEIIAAESAKAEKIKKAKIKAKADISALSGMDIKTMSQNQKDRLLTCLLQLPGLADDKDIIF